MNYQALYARLGDLTPMQFDCGLLCDKACCLGDAQTGMLLFPGEEALLPAGDGFALQPVDLPGYGKAMLYSCPGYCDRAARPLACRLFPLTLALSQGEVTLRPDVRGRSICPLCHKDLMALDPAFCEAALDVFRALYADDTCRPFLNAIVQQADELQAVLQQIDQNLMGGTP